MKVLELNKKRKISAPKEEVDGMIKKLKKENDKLVKGKFEFIDAQGGFLEFAYRFFPGDPLMTFKIHHGEICELPLGIVKHLNNTIKKVRKYNMEISESGPIRGIPTSYEKISRVRFTPIDYL